MSHRPRARALKSLLSLAFAGATALSTVASAQAQGSAIQFSGPSVVRSEPGEYTGRGFAPNQPVSIAVRAPDGKEAVFGAVADAQGKLSVRVSATMAGEHTIRILSTRGGELARALMVGQP